MRSNLPKFFIDAIARDIDSDVYQFDVRFRKFDGSWGNVIAPREYTARKLGEVLLAHGASMPDQDQAKNKLVQDALSDAPTTCGYSITRKLGWQRESVFVAHAWTVGDKSLYFKDENLFYPPLSMRKGNLQAWRAGLSEPCAASSFLAFGIGLAFAAPLLDVIGEQEGAVFHLSGESTSGKSLTQRAAYSVSARSGKLDLPTFDFTQIGVQELCAEHNDSLVTLDEHGRSAEPLSAKGLANLAYTMAGGRGRIRGEHARKSGHRDVQWRVLGLTSGEIPLAEITSSRAKGEEVRLIWIPVPARADDGIYDLLARVESDAMTLSQRVEDTITSNFGVAQQAYVHALIRDRVAMRAKAVRDIDRFLQHALVGEDPWERRFAKKFGIVAAAMAIAAELGIAPWKQKGAGLAAYEIYKRAREAIPSIEEKAKLILLQIRGLLDDTHFPVIEPGSSLPRHLFGTAIGFRRSSPEHGRLIAVLPGWFEEQADSQYLSREVLASMIKSGDALADSGGKRHVQILVNGFDRGRARWVCLKESAVLAKVE